MANAETKVERGYRIPRQRFTHRDEILNPGTQPEIAIFFAANMNNVPPISEVIPEQRYAVFDIREHKPASPVQPKIEEPQSIQTNLNISLTSSGIALATGEKLAGVSDLSRWMHRPHQRLKQFNRITGLADQLEKETVEQDPTRDVKNKKIWVALLRVIAESFYREELSQEPLTKTPALDIVNSRLPNAEAAVDEVGNTIKRLSFNIEDIFDEVGRALDGTSDRVISEETKQRMSAMKEEEREKKKASELPEKPPDIITDLAARTYSVWNVHKAKRGELTVFVYDPKLDEPSAEAAEYVRELFKKPF